jgi:hypothetical protein
MMRQKIFILDNSPHAEISVLGEGKFEIRSKRRLPNSETLMVSRRSLKCMIQHFGTETNQ